MSYAKEHTDPAGVWDDRHPAWEKTIVATLRDLQWHNKNKDDAAPSGFLSLDWTAESALGDAAMDINNRYYLLEMKSSPEKRAKELSKKICQKFEVKLAELDSAIALASMAFLQLSVRCHHFIYWQDADALDNAARRHGALVFSPYFRDLLGLREVGGDAARAERDAFLQEHALTRRDVASGESRFRFLKADALFDDSAAIIVRKAGDEGAMVVAQLPLGANAEEFDEYVAELLKDVADTVLLRMVLVSTKGGTMRYIENAYRLRAVMQELRAGPKLGQEPAEADIEQPIKWSPSTSSRQLNQRRVMAKKSRK